MTAPGQSEWHPMREAHSRGEYSRREYWSNEADFRNAAVSNRSVHPKFEDSEVLSFIDGAAVTQPTTATVSIASAQVLESAANCRPNRSRGTRRAS